ncbi:LysE family translocator [Acinetobacter sp. Tr-809]|uniref:LysE family translocator n=1 Tax=Acinetobacter sp. Tr-809 TaxID=2608324 RepID=UPI00141FE90D|nr:LysE family transporter [Acinetobacter sp. Tr-809]NIE97187.1 LysE family translocator [Acinetobacter sp. Tr-809]
MNEIIAVALVTLLTVISPGADFALVTRNSYLYGRHLGICTAYGIAMGVWVHISYSLIGLTFLQQYLPNLIQLIQYIGAGYLIHIGYKTFTQAAILFDENSHQITRWQAIRHGFLTNSLNPKTTLFIMSIYAQVMTSNNNLHTLIGYGVFISGSHLAWFCLVAIFCSAPLIRNKILARQVSINRVIGCILSALGLSLFFAHF